jgi:hypothetical protein
MTRLVSRAVLASRRARRGSVLLAACIAATLAAPAYPQALPTSEDVARALDAFSPYAAVGLGYDSNIYRLDDDAPEIGDSLADQYVTLAVGFDSRLEKRLQRFDINGELNHTLFGEHDELDYTGSKLNAIWHWVVSEGNGGDLGFRHRRTLRDFANQSTLNRIDDIRMENALFANGDFSLAPNWRAGARVDLADISYSETKRLDLQRTTVGGDVGYVSSASNWLGVDAEYVMGRYENNERSDFDEYTVGPKVEWKFTGRTTAVATAGYTSRNYDDASRADYDGATGRVELKVADDGRNGLDASIYRDLSNLDDEVADYAVVTGVKVEPRFKVRESFNLRFLAGYEQRDFDRDPSLDPVVVAADRTDDVYTVGAFVDWDVHSKVRLTFGADMQQRDSTRELQDYKFGRLVAKATGHF